MAVGPEEFFKRLEDSGLLNDSIVEQKDTLLAADSAEAAGAGLVARKLLTPFQSDVLVSGEQIPLVVGDYVVTDSIGRGGMGYVLKARHRRMKREVAIKFLLKSLTESDDLQRRFEREVEAAAQLDHQHIVTAYDAGIHEGSHYLVMQYVDGEDLSHLVKSSGPLDISDAVDLIRQAATGLGYAHDRGIIHRDIKPGNLLLDDEGVVRILDMGLARIMPSPGDALEGGAQADLTNTGSVMGTIDYMAPEQALDSKSVDHRTDIYALGCTLYFLLTSNPPFRNDTVMRRLLAHREQPAPKISEYCRDAPRELDDIFAMMMAKSPDDRFPSMKHLVVALESLELDNSEAEQMATLDMPDDGSGDFISLPQEDALGLPDLEQTFVTPDRPSPGPDTNKLPAFDATLIESSQQSSTVENDSLNSIDTDSTGISKTIIGNPPVAIGSTGSRSEKSHPPWKLIVPVGVALVALIAFLVTRPEPATDKPSQLPNSVVGQLQDAQSDDFTASDGRQNFSPDRHAAEFVLSVGGKVYIQRETQQSPEHVDVVPEEEFKLLGVELSSTRVTDDDLKNLRGLTALNRLAFWDTGITDRGLANLTDNGRVPLPKLASVRAMRTKISEDGIGFLKGSNLYRLHIGETLVSDLTSVCQNFPRLVELEIHQTEVSGDGLKHLDQLPLLKQLSISGNQWLDGGRDHVEKISGLNRLVVWYASKGFDANALANLPALEYLELQRLTGDQIGAEFWSRANALPLLSEIFLTGWGVDSSAVDQMPAMKQLRALTITHSHVEGQPLANAVKRLPNLETLRLDYNERLDAANVAHLASLTGLKNLRLKGTPNLTAAAIESLHRSLPNCRIESDYGTFEPGVPSGISPDRRAAEWVLSVGGLVEIQVIDGEYLKVLDSRKLPEEPFQVGTVGLTGTTFKDDDLKYLRGLAVLDTLSVWDSPVSDLGLAALTDSGRVPLPGLEHFVAMRAKISDDGIRYLAGSSRCRLLNLEATLVSDVSNIVELFPKLAELHLSGTGVSADGLVHLKKLSDLETLSVSGTQFQGRGAAYVRLLTGLKSFTAHDLPAEVSPAFLNGLTNLEQLTIQNDQWNALPLSVWESVRVMPQLNFLLLGACANNETLDQMPALPELRSLVINHAMAGSESMAQAAKRQPGLETLAIRYSGLTDADLKPFETLTSLQNLEITGNFDITEPALDSLQKALPACRIESNQGTFEPANK
jgi:serine/threonine protein kinase